MATVSKSIYLAGGQAGRAINLVGSPITAPIVATGAAQYAKVQFQILAGSTASDISFAFNGIGSSYKVAAVETFYEILVPPSQTLTVSISNLNNGLTWAYVLYGST